MRRSLDLDHSRYLSAERKREDAIGDPDVEYGSPYRAYGSTHRSATKSRIRRQRKRTERQAAKRAVKEE